MEGRWRTSRQLAGYKANIRLAINASPDGAYAHIDLKTAEAMIEIIDQSVHTKINHEQIGNQ